MPQSKNLNSPYIIFSKEEWADLGFGATLNLTENEITDFIPITYSLTGGGREINLSNFMIGILGQVIFSVQNNEQLRQFYLR